MEASSVARSKVTETWGQGTAVATQGNQAVFGDFAQVFEGERSPRSTASAWFGRGRALLALGVVRRVRE